MRFFFWYWLYNGILALILTLLPWCARRKPHWQEAFTERKHLWHRLDSSLEQRKWEKNLVWFHVASAGELLQALPVLERCLQHDMQAVLTYSSVNAQRWSQNTKKLPGWIVSEYLPLDTPFNMRRILAKIQPSCLVFVSYDLWPNLIWTARQQQIPQFLISGMIRPWSWRTRSCWGRNFYRELYQCMTGIYVISAADQQRFQQSIPTHPNLQVLGDTRYDSVVQRREQMKPLSFPWATHFTLIAGSTWSADEACIFPALKKALREQKDVFLVIAPHEPIEEHLQNSEAYFHEFPLVRWSQVDENSLSARILLIDQVGLLAGLYAFAKIAYVGGAFTTGVHNTMEPAAQGIPVFFGPKYKQAQEARQMIEEQIAFSVQNGYEFETKLFALLRERERCQELGAKAKKYIESQCGAADHCFVEIQKNLR